MIDLAPEPLRPRDLRAAELLGGDVSDVMAQLPRIPAMLRHPAILAAVRVTPISEGAWRSAARSLARLSPQQCETLRRLAHLVKSHSDLLDLLMRIRHAPLLATPFPAGPDLGPSFRPIADLAALKMSASAFRNCLASYATHAAEGRVFFYSFEEHGVKRAVVGLEPDEDHGWAVFAIAAYANRPLLWQLRDTIVAATTAALGPSLRDDPCGYNAAMRRVAAVGRARFPEAERQRLFAEMVQFFNWHAAGFRGAVCSYNSGEPLARQWVQLWSLDASECYECQIASHLPKLHIPHWLTEGSMALLEACRFRWPPKNSHFSRELRLRSSSDLQEAVDFFLGLHCDLWHHDPAVPITASQRPGTSTT